MEFHLLKRIQETIEKINEEWVEKQAKQWENWTKKPTEWLIKKGIKIIRLTPGTGCPGGRENESCEGGVG